MGADFDDWLARAERLFAAPRIMVPAVPKRYDWKPQPASVAENDFAETIIDDEAGNRGLVQLPRTVAALHLRTAVEFLAGIAALFRAREVHLSPATLARSAFETAIRGFLVIDPRATAKERRARGLLDELRSAERKRAAIVHLVGKSHPSYAIADKVWKRMIELTALEFADETSSDRSLIAGQTYPGMDKAAQSWAAWRRDDIGIETIGRDEAAGYYDFLCLHTHPQGFAGHQTAFWSTDPEVEPGFRTDLIELAKLTLVSHACVMDLARAFYDYHGWESFELDTIATVANELWLEPERDES